MTFTAIVVGHGDLDAVARMMRNLRGQTRKPDEILIYACCGGPGVVVGPTVTFTTTDHQGDWGHQDRARGLAEAAGDWIGWFNSDDTYHATYLERMLNTATDTGADVVYCEWNENPGCTFNVYKSTAGNFIVRTPLARQVGWTGRHYEADGDFIEGLNRAGAHVVKIHDRLYEHNPA